MLLKCVLSLFQTVHLPSKPAVSGLLQKVRIHQVKRLVISQSVCVDLMLDHVQEVQVVAAEDASSSCSCCKSLYAEHVQSLNRLPDGVRNLLITASNVTEVVMDHVDAIMTISQATVNRLRVSETIERHVEVTLYEVHVHHLEKLHLAKNASLSIDKCVIDNIPDGALVLATAKNSIDNVTFYSGKNGSQIVVLEKGADLTLTETMGSLEVRVKKYRSFPPVQPIPSKVPEEPQEPPQKHTTSEPEKCHSDVESHTQDCGNISMILLILLVISFGLNAVQLLFNQPRRLIDKLVYRNYSSTQQYFNSVESSVESESKASNDHVFLPLTKDSQKTSPATASLSGSDEDVVYEKGNPKRKTGTTNDKPSAAFPKKTSSQGSSHTSHTKKTGIPKTENRGDKLKLTTGKTNKPLQLETSEVSNNPEKEMDPLLGAKAKETKNQPVPKGPTQTRGLI